MVHLWRDGFSGGLVGHLGHIKFLIFYLACSALAGLAQWFFSIFFLGFWFVQQALYGVASLQVRSNVGMEGGGGAYWAHAGGFIFGVILGPLFGLFSTSNRD